jgi:hypothetical protein
MKAPYLMTSAALVFPAPTARLPAVPSGPYDDLEQAARDTVRVLVQTINQVVVPVIVTLDVT